MAVQFREPDSSTLRIKFGLSSTGELVPSGGNAVTQKQFSFKGIKPDVQDDAFQNFATRYLTGIFGVAYDVTTSSLSVIKPYDI